MKKELGENILLRKKERAEKSCDFQMEGRGVSPLDWDPEGVGLRDLPENRPSAY